MATQKAAFQLDFIGGVQLIDNIAELELRLDAVNKQLREAKKSGNQDAYKQLRQESAGLKENIKDLNKELREQKKVFDATKFAAGSYDDLNAQLVKARREFRELGEEARNGVGGQDLLKRIQRLDKELKDLDNTLGQNFRNVGNYQESFQRAIDATVSGLSGNLNLGQLATIFGTGGAIGAGIAALSEGISIVSELTAEFVKLRGEVQQLTGATGDNLDEYAVGVSAIADTFGRDANEVLLAANALTDQLTGDFNKSLELIEAGFLSGADANGEFLDTLREYPAFFREANLTGEQFVSLISQSVQEGIFSDKGIDAIKEAELRLRELPKATEAALSSIGVSSEEIRRTISEKGVGAAIQQVSEQLSKFEDDSKEAGQVLADVFGGPGEDAGIQFVKSLQNINGSLDELVDTSNQYVVNQQKSLDANRRFAEAQNDLAKALGATDGTLKSVGAQIKAVALEALVFLINGFKDLYAFFKPVLDGFGDIFRALGIFNSEGRVAQVVVNGLSKVFNVLSFPLRVVRDLYVSATERVVGFINGVKDLLRTIGLISEQEKNNTEATLANLKKLQDQLKANSALISQSNSDQADGLDKVKSATESASSATGDHTKKLSENKDAVDALAKTSLAFLQKQLNDLRKELETAPDAESYVAVVRKIEIAERALNQAIAERRNLSDSGLLQTLQSLPADDLESSFDALEGYLNEITADRITAEDRVQQITLTRDEQTRKIIKDREQLRAEEREREEEEYWQKVLSFASSAASGIASAFFQVRRNNLENDLQATQTALDEEYQQRIENAEGNATLQAELEAELAAKKEKLEKEAAEKRKRIAIGEGIAQLALGIIEAIPDPFRIAAAGILGAAQLAVIRSQQFGEGGLIEGPSHNAGGVPMTVRSTGQRVELEGGEGVINKRSMASGDLLSVTGTPAQIADQINKYKGYGKSFFAQQFGPKFQDGGTIPQVVNPNTAFPGSFTAVEATFSDEQINTLADRVATKTGQEARRAIGEGLDDANRAKERNEFARRKANI